MQLGMIGLGRMGASMVRRLMAQGHACVVHDSHPAAVQALAGEGAVAAAGLADLAARLARPRAVWMMVPAAGVDALIDALSPHLEPGDILVDGGNSHYRDDLRRAAALGERGLHYVDVGTSGGVAGRERGYCLMVGGDRPAYERLRPVLAALAPGPGPQARTPGCTGPASDAEAGFLHCGASGAGHFVKMVHNGIEYGLMAAYAEGLNVLRHAGAGRQARRVDAETAPLRDPEAYQYDFDLADIAELWRRGSVIGSWLLDLTARALRRDPALAAYGGHVADSGEGRWTIQAALDESVPAPVLTAALYDRFASRGEAAFAHQVLSAMRHEFGGHAEAPATGG